MEQEHLPITLPVLEKMQLAPADNVLDVGCGAGWLSRRLAKLVPQGRVVGMDVSDEMIRRARCASVDFENLIFVTGEVEEIPWEPNFFSHVISVESAYYWPDSVAGIREIFRVLKPGGSAWILINYYRDNPHAHQWGGLLAVETHLLSAAEWSERFRAAAGRRRRSGLAANRAIPRQNRRLSYNPCCRRREGGPGKSFCGRRARAPRARYAAHQQRGRRAPRKF